MDNSLQLLQQSSGALSAESYQTFEMAKENDGIPYRVNVNDGRFLAPENMTAEVEAAVGRGPLSIGERFAVVYHSLADCYRETMKEIETLLGREMKAIHIVGGGCKDEYLCELTARACGKPVYAGPVEATAIGNIASQMIATGEFQDLNEARRVIFNSFDVKKV